MELEIERLDECTTCHGSGWELTGDGAPCPDCLPPGGATSCGGTGYVGGRDRLNIKQVLRWLAVENNVQCSGKQLIGSKGSIGWCQLTAFHEGACEAPLGTPFHEKETI